MDINNILITISVAACGWILRDIFYARAESKKPTKQEVIDKTIEALKKASAEKQEVNGGQVIKFTDEDLANAVHANLDNYSGVKQPRNKRS